MKNSKFIKVIKKLILIGVICFLVVVVLPNAIVVLGTMGHIKDTPDENYEYTLVLGAAIWGGEPSPMLRDRLSKSVELYKEGKTNTLFMSGDNERDFYDETTAMRKYATDNGVPEDDVMYDDYGLSTYDSMYRAKNVYGIDKMIIVTQKYHMYRAVYIARRLGIDAVGVPAESIKYSGREAREVREILARCKDFVKSMIKPKSSYTE